MCGDHELSHSPPALSCDHECLLSHSPPALACVLTPDDGTREAESRAALSGGETFKNLVNSCNDDKYRDSLSGDTRLESRTSGHLTTCCWQLATRTINTLIV